MVWKNWFELDQNWFGLEQMVWFGSIGLVWFGIGLVWKNWFGLEELVWSRHLDMKSVSVEYQILKADERITTRDASEFD